MKPSLLRLASGVALLLVGISLALCLAGALYAPPSAIPRPLRGKHVEVGDVRLRVLQQGTGRDLLFLHGSPGLLEDFEPQAQVLSRSFHVTRYDRPGHGFSSAGESHTLAYNARVALALIEKLALNRVVVVGHSYGGSSALALALQRSPRIAAYVLLDSAVYRHVHPTRPLYNLLALPVLGLGVARALPRARVETDVGQALRREFVAAPPPGFIALRSRMWSEPKVMQAMGDEQSHSQAELSLQSRRYGEIAAPVYFAAQRDNAPRRENAQQFKRDVPQAVIELLPNTGHYVQFEQAEAVTQLIVRAAESSATRPLSATQH